LLLISEREKANKENVFHRRDAEDAEKLFFSDRETPIGKEPAFVKYGQFNAEGEVKGE